MRHVQQAERGPAAASHSTSRGTGATEISQTVGRSAWRSGTRQDHYGGRAQEDRFAGESRTVVLARSGGGCGHIRAGATATRAVRVSVGRAGRRAEQRDSVQPGAPATTTRDTTSCLVPTLATSAARRPVCARPATLLRGGGARRGLHIAAETQRAPAARAARLRLAHVRLARISTVHIRVLYQI